MPNAFGGQSQRFDGVVQAIRQSQASLWKWINPDSEILRAAKEANPNITNIVRIYTGAPTVDDKVQHPDPERYGYDYATLVYSQVQDPAHMDLLESENEINDHYGDLTEFIKRTSAFLVGFSRRAKELGFRPLGPNFSTGYPEVYVPNSDYELWPNAWQGLSDGLRALRDSNGALSIHEYDSPDLFRLWSDTKQRGYLVGRHKAIYECLPSDLQSLPLYITEFGIDWLTQGVEGGFWHNRDENAYQFMIEQNREVWRRIYSTTPQLRGISQFLWGTTDPHFTEYDMRLTDPSIAGFTAFFGETLPPSTPMLTPFVPTHYPFSRVYPISQLFGANPAYYAQFGLPGHDGTDFACPVGTPFCGVASGVVSLVSQSGVYGWHITVTHPDGYQTLYAHMSRFDVKQGDSVKGGTQLGLSGQSGNVTGPHLHISLMHPGTTYVDANGVSWPYNLYDPSAINSIPPTGVIIVSTPQERINHAWQSTNIVYNPDAAFPKIAQKQGLGRPVGNEYNYVSAGGSRLVGQGFERAFLEALESDVLAAKAYDWLTGLEYVPSVTPPPVTGIPPYSFPQVLTDNGACGEEGQPIASKPFYRINSAVVRQGVSAFAKVQLMGKGAQIVNLFPDGHGEVFSLVDNGEVQFNFGATSAFSNPCTGPFTLFVAEGAVKDPVTKAVTWKNILSDKVKSVGDWQAEHSEFTIQFKQVV